MGSALWRGRGSGIGLCRGRARLARRVHAVEMLAEFCLDRIIGRGRERSRVGEEKE